MQETQVWSLGQEDRPEEETAIHSSILAWKIPWTEEPAKSQTQLKWLGTHREKLLPILAFAWTTSESLYRLSYSYKLMNSLVTQMVKNMPAVWETWVWSLGQEDSLKKGMATHSSILAWRIPWTEEPGGPLSMGSHRVGYDWVTTVSLSMNGHEKAEWVSYP